MHTCMHALDRDPSTPCWWPLATASGIHQDVILVRGKNERPHAERKEEEGREGGNEHAGAGAAACMHACKAPLSKQSRRSRGLCKHDADADEGISPAACHMPHVAYRTRPAARRLTERLI